MRVLDFLLWDGAGPDEFQQGWTLGIALNGEPIAPPTLGSLYLLLIRRIAHFRSRPYRVTTVDTPAEQHKDSLYLLLRTPIGR